LRRRCRIGDLPAGSVAIGGGYDGNAQPPVEASVTYNYPIGNDTAWGIGMVNNAAAYATFTP
jgi:hypothetical protein